MGKFLFFHYYIPIAFLQLLGRLLFISNVCHVLEDDWLPETILLIPSILYVTLQQWGQIH